MHAAVVCEGAASTALLVEIPNASPTSACRSDAVHESAAASPRPPSEEAWKPHPEPATVGTCKSVSNTLHGPAQQTTSADTVQDHRADPESRGGSGDTASSASALPIPSNFVKKPPKAVGDLAAGELLVGCEKAKKSGKGRSVHVRASACGSTYPPQVVAGPVAAKKGVQATSMEGSGNPIKTSPDLFTDVSISTAALPGPSSCGKQTPPADQLQGPNTAQSAAHLQGEKSLASKMADPKPAMQSSAAGELGNVPGSCSAGGKISRECQSQQQNPSKTKIERMAKYKTSDEVNRPDSKAAKHARLDTTVSRGAPVSVSIPCCTAPGDLKPKEDGAPTGESARAGDGGLPSQHVQGASRSPGASVKQPGHVAGAAHETFSSPPPPRCTSAHASTFRPVPAAGSLPVREGMKAGTARAPEHIQAEAATSQPAMIRAVQPVQGSAGARQHETFPLGDMGEASSQVNVPSQQRESATIPAIAASCKSGDDHNREVLLAIILGSASSSKLPISRSPTSSPKVQGIAQTAVRKAPHRLGSRAPAPMGRGHASGSGRGRFPVGVGQGRGDAAGSGSGKGELPGSASARKPNQLMHLRHQSNRREDRKEKYKNADEPDRPKSNVAKDAHEGASMSKGAAASISEPSLAAPTDSKTREGGSVGGGNKAEAARRLPQHHGASRLPPFVDGTENVAGVASDGTYASCPPLPSMPARATTSKLAPAGSQTVQVLPGVPTDAEIARASAVLPHIHSYGNSATGALATDPDIARVENAGCVPILPALLRIVAHHSLDN